MTLKLILIHPSEEAVKGTYRPLFERNLIIKLSNELKGLSHKSIKKKYQRIFIELDNNSKIDKIKSKLKKIPEIGYFSFPIKTLPTLEKIKETSLELLNSSKGSSFRPKVKVYKQFKIKATELTKIMGDYLMKSSNKTLDFIESEITIYIEVVENAAYIYSKRYNL